MHNKHLQAFLTVLSFSLALHGSQASLAHLQTVAHQKHPLLKKEALGIANAHTQKRLASASLFPQITIAQTNTTSRAYRTSETTRSHTLSLQGSQIIFAPGGPLSERTKATHDIALSKYSLIKQQNAVRYEVTCAFLDAWLLQEEKATLEAHVAYTKALCAQAHAQSCTGAADKHNVAAQALAHQKSNARLVAHADREQAAHQLLMRQIGSTVPISHLSYTPETMPPLLLQEEYYAQACAARPEVATLHEAMKKQDVTTTALKAGHLPRVSLDTQLSCPLTTESVDPFLSLSVTINMPIFDGGQRKLKAEHSSAKRQQLVFEKQHLMHTIKSDVFSAYAHCITAQQAVSTAAYAVQETNYRYEAACIDAKTGRRSEIDLLQATYLLSASRYEHTKALISLRKAREKLLFVCGYPEQEHCKTRNTGE